MFFLRREAHINPLFKDSNILKFHDKIALENSIFIHKSFKHQLPDHLITGLDSPQIFIPTTQGGSVWAVLMYLLTELYGRNSVCISAIFTWNYLQNLHRNILFHKLTTNSLKKLLTLHFLRKYV